MLKPTRDNVICEPQEKKSAIIIDQPVTAKELVVIAIGKEVTEIKKGDRIVLEPNVQVAEAKDKDKIYLIVKEGDIICTR